MIITLRRGLTEGMRPAAARLYLEAFDAKLGPILGRGPRACVFMESVLNLDQALGAVDEDGALVGVAGFHDGGGGFVGGGEAELRAAYGRFGALWRGLALSLFDKAPVAGQFQMDGIVVADGMRGRGVGSLLLDALEAEARQAGCAEIRLEVVDANPGARALYERRGFRVTATDSAGLLAPFLGFRRAYTMTKPL